MKLIDEFMYLFSEELTTYEMWLHNKFFSFKK
jgi:hypothetical protein